MRLIVFLWKIFNNALPTRNILYHHHLPILQDCPLCDSGEPESIYHLFFCFPFARAVWFGSPLQIRSDHIPDHAFKSLIFDWLIQDTSFTNLGGSSITLSNSHLVVFLLYEIWFSRNQKIFRKTEIHPSSTILQAVHNFHTNSIARSKFPRHTLLPNLPTLRNHPSFIHEDNGSWLSTPSSTILLFSSKSHSRYFYVSVFMQDTFIKVIQVQYTLDKLFKLVGGLWMLRKILLQARDRLQQQIKIITSSPGLAQAIRPHSRISSQLRTLQQDCIQLLCASSFQCFKFGESTN